MGSFYRADFNVYTNADWVEAFRMEVNGDPVSLAGKTLRFNARPIDRGHELMVIDNATNGGINVLNANAGLFEIRVRAETLSNKRGQWRHELLLLDDESTILIWEGKLMLREGVTE